MNVNLIYNRLERKFGKQNWWPTISSSKRFEVIIGTILTQYFMFYY